MTTELEQTEAKRKPGRPPAKKWEQASAQGVRTDRQVHDNTVHEYRAHDEREAEQIHDMEDEPWVNPASLPYIPPRKGMVQRYIRVALRGEADPTNTARKFREGWVPRRVDSVPKNIPVPRIESGKYTGCVGVEGMVLCEMSAARNEARNHYFLNKNIRQTQSVDQRLNEETQHHSTAFGPVKAERRTQVVREVPIAADE